MLASYMYPEAGPQELLFGTMYVLWLFFFDDIFDESKFLKEECNQAAERSLHIFRTGKAPEKNAKLNFSIVQLEDLLLRIFAMANDLAKSSDITARFMKSCEIYFVDGAVPMENFRQMKTLPKLEEYLAVRTIDGGAAACIACFEIVAHLDLSDEIVNEPRVLRMCEIAGQQIAYANDIYSYHREKLHNNSMNSLNIRCQTLSFEDALTEQIAQLNGWVQEVLFLIII
eukprot:Phypoly_transcript_08742.p1 GENE.Phypoly_transcript_08742~~Phypoly_transcript_08742.p1  ORF type:complete len:228 (+),score=38.89 Phypoly_transcript_08742:427-1110(+)